MSPTPSAEQTKKQLSADVVTIALTEWYYMLFSLSVYLCIMSTHGSITSEGASRVTVTGVWKRVVFDLIVPWFHKLKNGSIAVNKRQTKRHCTHHMSKWATPNVTFTNTDWSCYQIDIRTTTTEFIMFKEKLLKCGQRWWDSETFKTQHCISHFNWR